MWWESKNDAGAGCHKFHGASCHNVADYQWEISLEWLVRILYQLYLLFVITAASKQVLSRVFDDFYFLITYGVCKKRKYCNCMREKKKFYPFDECSCFICLERQNTQKNSVCLSGCLSGCLAVRTWTFAVDTITFEGVSGSKKNLVGVFYVWNVGLVLKYKVKSLSWSWSLSWT